MATETDKRRLLQEMPNGEDARTRHGDGGGPGRACDAPVQDIDEQRIQKDIKDSAARHDPHRLLGIARGTHQAGEVERQRGHKHTRQHDVHILSCVCDGVVRSTKRRQDFVHEEVAACDEEETEEESQQEAVAQDVLGPFVVFLAQDDGHACRRPRSHQRSEGMDDIHDGHGDGQSRDGKRTHILTQEDTVDDVINRGNDVADDARQSIHPQ